MAPNTINAYIIENKIGKGTLGGVYSTINQYTDEKVAIKIYSSAILNYGTKMSFKDMLNIYKDKKN